MNESPRPQTPTPTWMPYFIGATIFVLLYMFLIQAPVKERRYEIPYTHFKALLKDQQIEEVFLRGEIVEGQLYKSAPIGPQDTMGKSFRTRVPSFGDETLLPELEAQGVEVKVGAAQEENLLTSFLIGMLPWLLFFLVTG